MSEIKINKKYILASKSPRRFKILEELGLNFEVIPSKYKENIEKNEIFSYEKIEKVALNKAQEVYNRLKSPCIIISADTCVVIDNKILIKPESKIDAFETLKLLSNKMHFVVTSVVIIDGYSHKTEIHSETSEVTFTRLSDEMIENYILNYKPYDKAGSYGIQEIPKSFIKKINGSISNIIGLPKEYIKKKLNI